MAKIFTPKLSPRLEMVVSMVPSKDMRVADIGCDHGYISISLIQRNIASYAIASDIKEGPLKQAQKNIEKAELGEKIITRLAPGISGLSRKDADCIIIAGMGCRTIIEILEENEIFAKSARYLILQPQSEIPELREYLRNNGYTLVKNRMAVEGEKYYFAMLVVPTEQLADAGMESISGKIRESMQLPEMSELTDRLDMMFGLDLICEDRELSLYLKHVEHEWSGALENLENAKKTDVEKMTLIRNNIELAQAALEMNVMFCGLDSKVSTIARKDYLDHIS